jgi:NAD-dependent SIR2 family protein deacetylase
MTKKRMVVFSGAGLSAESGIPTFRDSNGLWENHKVEDVAWDYELIEGLATVGMRQLEKQL